MAAPITGADTQFLDVDPSALCTTGKQPLNLTGAIVYILRRHFSDADVIKDEDLRAYLWKPQPADTTAAASGSEILIEPLSKLTGQPSQYLQQRPAALVKRNRWSSKKLGVGDRYTGVQRTANLNNRVNDYALDSSQRYEILITGSHTVFCIGGTPAEAEAVATESFFELLEFAQLIRTDLGLGYFKVNGIEPVSRLEESHEHFVAPIVLTYTFFHGWRLRNETVTLGSFSL
jgi:hypothetical protein